MIGPSVCVMCHRDEETIGNLFQGCDWVRAMWEKGGALFGKPRLGEATIQDTIENWIEKAFQNVILNRIWEIFPGIVVWETWKERNNRKFEGRKRQPAEAWTLIQAHIKETLGLKRC